MATINSINARLFARNAVEAWFDEPSLDLGKKLMDAPTAGYGLTEGAYMQLCDTVQAQLSQTTGRKLNLPGNWRVKHEGDTVVAFINAVAVALLAAGMTPKGKKALTWAMKIDGGKVK